MIPGVDHVAALDAIIAALRETMRLMKEYDTEHLVAMGYKEGDEAVHSDDPIDGVRRAMRAAIQDSLGHCAMGLETMRDAEEALLLPDAFPGETDLIQAIASAFLLSHPDMMAAGMVRMDSE